MTASARRAVFGLMLVPVLTVAPCLPAFADAAPRTVLEDEPSCTSQVPVVGNAPAVEPQHLVVVLTLQGEAGAEALACDVSDPASPQYGRHISSAEWRFGFAPTDASVSGMTDGLTSQEVPIGSIPANPRNIPFSGTTAQSEAAFAIERGWGTGKWVLTGGAWVPNRPCPIRKCRPPQPAGLARPAAATTPTEQQVTDLRLQRDDRDQDLTAARAANRELIAQLNTATRHR